jgi:hypothetical protein
MSFGLYEGDFKRPSEAGIQHILEEFIRLGKLPPTLDRLGAISTLKIENNSDPNAPISQALLNLTEAVYSRNLLNGLIDDGGGFLIQGSGRDREWAVQLGSVTISNIPGRVRNAFKDPNNVQPIIEPLRSFLDE